MDRKQQQAGCWLMIILVGFAGLILVDGCRGKCPPPTESQGK